MSRWHIVVLVPARNEEELLPRCLESIARARKQVLSLATTDVIVVADHSSDRTALIANELLGPQGSVLTTSQGNVGAARALAAVAALRRSPVGPERCWLANTDADCCVPDTWLLDQLAAAELGYHAVAGIVDVDHFTDHDPHVPDRFRRTYLVHADGTHPHVHAANLGVRADAYLQVGGWSSLETAEDHDLWSRLCCDHWRRRSDSSIVVLTSGRRIGQAPNGFAAALSAHNQPVMS